MTAYHHGLKGSKAELIAALSLMKDRGLFICNGYRTEFVIWGYML